MNNKKTFVSTSKNNISSLFISFLLLKKQLYYYFANKLSAITLYVIFGLITAVTAGTASGGEKTLTPYDYLTQISRMPVEYLASIYMAKPDLQHELPEVSHPFFSVLTYEKKQGLTRQSLHSSSQPDDLNHLLPHSIGNKYIDQKQMVWLAAIPLYQWLIREYRPFSYRVGGAVSLTSSLTVTIDGMLADLEQRKKNGDVVATLVLTFLKRPYVKVAPESTDQTSFFSRYTKQLSQLFYSPTELSFSEQLARLTDSPYTNEQHRQQRLLQLKMQKYQYEYHREYTFTGYETDENGETIPVPSNDIMLTHQESQALLEPGYRGLNKSDTTDIMGMKFSNQTMNQIGTVALLTAIGFSMVGQGYTSAIPPRRCEKEGSCSPQNYSSLFGSNFTTALAEDPAGHFQLAENITLNDQQDLPVLQSQNACFSGVLETGNHTLHAGNGTSPVFNCVDKGMISGNFNFCPTQPMSTAPLIADQVLNGSIINIQQSEACNMQRPALGDIRGDHNQISFTGTAGTMHVKNETGIVASSVSGNGNVITAQEGKLDDSPLVSVAGGSDNIYRQEKMSSTRYTKDYVAGHKFLVADQFVGNKTTVVQHKVNGTFLAPAQHSRIRSDNADTKNGTTSTYVSDTKLETVIFNNTARITNINDNALNRSVVENNGRFEIYNGHNWSPVCQDTLHQKTADVACHSLGYNRAMSERDRLLLKDTFSPTMLQRKPVHAPRCTGYEQHLGQCRSAENGTCWQNGESLLACTNDKRSDTTTANTTLTDFNSGSPDRFDTTNTREGRLEQRDLSGRKSTVCAAGFNNQSANVACNSMGYNGGHIAPVQTAPLPVNIPILVSNWNCSGNETSLFQCPYQNLTHHNCTHADDVVLRCNLGNYGFLRSRLTDRNNIGEYRANTTSSGLGRLELYDAGVPTQDILQAEDQSIFNLTFIGFCNGSFNDPAIKTQCQQLGFNDGRRVYALNAKSLQLPGFYNAFKLSYTCERENNNACRVGYLNETHCQPGESNLVALCHNGIPERPHVVTKSCSHPDQTLDKTILFSGEYNLAPAGCTVKQCPVQYFDGDNVPPSERFDQYCSDQELHTTRPEDWMKMWNARCNTLSSHCNCHIPNEQFLGVVAANNTYDTLLVSRQQYTDNEDSNQQGLVRVSKLFSIEAPQLLSPANEALVTGTLPVNQIVTKQHLLGLYPGSEQGSVQLFLSSQANDNNEYHAKTFSVNGEPLLLTNNSVFVKDTESSIIKQHKLHVMTDSDMPDLNLGHAPHRSIDFPENVTNIVAAAEKNEWLYVAAVNELDENQVSIMRYNTTAELWENVETQQTDDLSHLKNHQLIVNDNDQVQLLSPGEIPLTHPVLVSIPNTGGCASLSGEMIPERKTTEIPPSTEPGLEGQEKSDNGVGLGVKVGVPLAVVIPTVWGVVYYWLVKTSRNAAKKSEASRAENANNNSNSVSDEGTHNETSGDTSGKGENKDINKQILKSTEV